MARQSEIDAFVQETHSGGKQIPLPYHHLKSEEVCAHV